MRWMSQVGAIPGLVFFGALWGGWGFWSAGLLGAGMVGIVLLLVIHPTLWQLRHPRKAWWMAHTGRKIVEDEAKREEILRRPVPRQHIVGTPFGGFIDTLATPLNLSGQIRVRSDGLVGERVRIHMPAFAAPHDRELDGAEGIVQQRLWNGDGRYLYEVQMQGGVRIRILSEYCVAIGKENADA